MPSRDETLRAIEGGSFDVCVIGGGATGAACALDAQLRGLKTVLVEAGDFAGATSSKSTKIIHGGVRYLEEAVKDLDAAEYHVVNRALHERILMLKNGAYLSRTLEFLIPCFHWLDAGYYDVGLKLYDWIAGDTGIFPSHFLSRHETLRRMPTLKNAGLVGSIAYADGQFNDAAYNIALVKAFVDAEGTASNYLRVTDFRKAAKGTLAAAEVEDQLSHRKFVIRARAFVNSTGPLADTVRNLATPGIERRMRLSKGSHILLPLDVLPSEDAMLIPKTEDGRVLFAVPWMGRLLVGTTEQEIGVDDELYVTKDEVDFILRQLNQYLEEPVARSRVVSGFAGARPLVSRGGSSETKKLSRDDELEIDPRSGLISIMGGKWTTHRAMAEDTIDAVQKSLGLPVTPSLTRNRPLPGSNGFTPVYWMSLVRDHHVSEQTAQHLAGRFGTAAPMVLDLAEKDGDLAKPIVEGLPPIRAEIIQSARDMAVTIEDVLARRIGLEFFSWRSSMEAAPVVGSILGQQLGWSAEHTQSAIGQYVEKIQRYLRVAGLAPDRPQEHQARPPATDIMAPRSSKKVVYAALLGNLLVALTKFAAAGLTGSSAMVSEAIHSLVDTGNEILLLYGMRRAARPPDELHPLGHGRELYFWSFIVTLLVFALGAGVSVYEGISHVIAPVPISNAIVNYVVLGLAFVFEGISWGVAIKEFRSAKGKRGYLDAVRQSKDPTMFMVLFEDTAALIGVMIALAGIAASETLDRPVLDGAASIGIGILLGVVAMFLAREVKGLLIGEPAASEVVSSICAIARAHPGVERSNGLFTVQLGPDQIVAAISIDFMDTLSAADVEAIVAAIEERVRSVHPEVVLLLIKPQSAAAFERARVRPFGRR